MANVVRRVGQSTRAGQCPFAPKMCLEWCRSPGLKEPVIGVHEVSCPAPPHSHYSARTRRLHLQPFHSLRFSPGQDIGSRGGSGLGCTGWALKQGATTGERRGKRRVWREIVGSIHKSIRALFSPARVWVSCNGQSGSAQTLTTPVTTL